MRKWWTRRIRRIMGLPAEPVGRSVKEPSSMAYTGRTPLSRTNDDFLTTGMIIGMAASSPSYDEAPTPSYSSSDWVGGGGDFGGGGSSGSWDSGSSSSSDGGASSGGSFD